MFIEILRAALFAVRANTLRSVLTALGIIVGVASTIAVVSVVQGLRHSVVSQFQSLGSSALTIQSFTSMEDRTQGKRARLNFSDLELIEQRIDGITHVTPMLFVPNGSNGGIQYRSQTSTANIIGTNKNYIKLDDWVPSIGRFILTQDDETRRRVAILGRSAVDSLELPDDPRGIYITIANEWFKVVGVMEERGELLGFDQDDIIFVPYSAAQTLLGYQTATDIQIRLRVAGIENLTAVQVKIERLLREHRGLSGDQPNDFKIQTSDQLLESFETVTGMVTAVLGGIVGISLLVGGIGIMNIMLVSVTERTREIGINKALGATRNFILLQFLSEAIILCLVGGLIGLGLGYGLGVAVALMLPGFPPAQVPLWAIFLALGFSASVGILFGIAPAAKAANLDPVEALRYE